MSAERTKLKITTVTPVAIGSGNELSPYADYVVDRNRVFYIDRKKLQRKIAHNDQLLECYITGIASKMDNNRSEFDLKRFLLNAVKVNIEDVSLLHCPMISRKPESKLTIKSMLKTPFHEPYFPGSSLKGALKTVLMYAWLNSKKASEWVEDFLKKCGEPDRNESDKGINRLLNDLESKFEYSESHPQVLQQVADSSPIAKESVTVVDGTRNMPIRIECIQSRVQSTFELCLCNKTWNELANSINAYAINVLYREEDLIKDDDNLIDYYNRLVEIQEKIQDLIDDAVDGVAYLRIGYGKGFYFNSIAEVVYEYAKKDNAKFRLYENYMKRLYPPKPGKTFKLDDFPKTRLYIDKTQEPLGWVKIEKI